MDSIDLMFEFNTGVAHACRLSCTYELTCDRGRNELPYNVLQNMSVRTVRHQSTVDKKCFHSDAFYFFWILA